MRLCINSFLPEGSIVLFHKDLQNDTPLLYKLLKANKRNIVREIDACVQKASIAPGDISALYFLEGPGPFTAVRTIATIVNSWKLSLPHVKLYAVSTGVFLSSLFPKSEHLFLSAGKSAFFTFDQKNPKKFKKHPISKLTSYSGMYGGYFHPDTVIPVSLSAAPSLTDTEAFQNILQAEDLSSQNFALPIYGAEANITFTR